MKMRIIILGLLAIVAVTFAPIASKSDNVGPVNRGQNQKQLQLTTSIVRERYCSGRGAKFLEWTLNLEYTNRGDRPILLDKKSSRVSRSFVSRNLRAAAARQYESAPIPVYGDLGALGFVGTPEEDKFVVLNPGESLTLQGDCRINVYDFRSKNHVLQVKVSTWRYYADPKEYRDKWIGKGYLWFEVVTSEPMPFTIEKQPKVVPCSQ
jgi:hypothetical protein